MTEPALVVAIVDDEGEVGRALTRLVRSLGHGAETFTSGPAFLAWLRGLRGRGPDCVLLDIQMPEMSGFEVQRLVSRDHASVRCIFITGSSDSAEISRAAEQGSGLLRKPFNEEQLVAALRHATER
jgi:FixJ family two-component response regulator